MLFMECKFSAFPVPVIKNLGVVVSIVCVRVVQVTLWTDDLK